MNMMYVCVDILLYWKWILDLSFIDSIFVDCMYVVMMFG